MRQRIGSQRGNLNAGCTGVDATPEMPQNRDLDAAGDWVGFEADNDGDTVLDVDEDGDHKLAAARDCRDCGAATEMASA